MAAGVRLGATPDGLSAAAVPGASRRPVLAAVVALDIAAAEGTKRPFDRRFHRPPDAVASR